MVKIAIVDTMFSRVNMGALALDELAKAYPKAKTVRRTVPGVKDLAVECRKLLDGGCDVALALGMVGGAPIDTQCGHEASLGIQQAKLLTNKHIVEVFVHENEGWNEQEFREICENRIRKHAHNAVLLVENPQELVENAGKGVRQGREDEGEINGAGNKPIELGLVVCEFNREMTEAMEKRAVEHAKKQGASVVSVLRVPGAYDAPLAAKKLLLDKRIDAVVTVGAIIKGDTKHDELIAGTAAEALTALSLGFNRPVTLGIIGPGANEKDAEARKSGYAERAVEAAVKLVKRLRR